MARAAKLIHRFTVGDRRFGRSHTRWILGVIGRRAVACLAMNAQFMWNDGSVLRERDRSGGMTSETREDSGCGIERAVSKTDFCRVPRSARVILSSRVPTPP